MQPICVFVRKIEQKLLKLIIILQCYLQTKITLSFWRDISMSSLPKTATHMCRVSSHLWCRCWPCSGLSDTYMRIQSIPTDRRWLCFLSDYYRMFYHLLMLLQVLVFIVCLFRVRPFFHLPCANLNAMHLVYFTFAVQLVCFVVCLITKGIYFIFGNIRVRLVDATIKPRCRDVS